ncbi:hypothetical protein JAAARDRAFT_188032 [Jaapia argillacea MUCL 33604]|uniref:Nucleoporin NSP1 n=1 Tax=Jaapia argillacea MUCL 33604 TaxID=933084 RepID=A0A067QCN1_9AGAM|nr:hypothetical protein JAAARDRAFT_188032 [Jaapia argillacea MUCL 33604]
MSFLGTGQNTTNPPAGTSQPGNIFGNLGGTGTTTPGAGAGATGSGTPNSFFGGSAFGAPKPAGTPGGLFGGGTNTLFGGNSSGANPLAGGLSSGTNPLGGGGSSGVNPLMGGGASGKNPLLGGGNNKNPLFGGGSSGTNSLMGGGAAGATTPSPFNLFAKPTDSTSTAGSKAPSSFFAPPTSSTPGTVPPASGGLFPNPGKPADTSASTGQTQSSGVAPNLFAGIGLTGFKPDAATTAPAAVAAPPPSLFSLGGNKDTSAPKSATPTLPPGGLFANLGGNKPEEKKDGTAAAAPGPAPSPFNLFGAPKPAEKKDTPPAAPPTFALAGALGGSALGGAKEAEKPKDATGAATSALTAPSANISTVAVPPPSMLRGKSIEEIVNRWTSDLETHVRDFAKFAGEVAAWDRTLIENGNNLAALYNHVLAAEREQNDIDQAVDHIEQQQKDLSSTLEAYEKSTDEILGSGGSLRALDTGPADAERDKNYMLATDLHTHLDDLSGSLSQMIEAVNALSLPSSDAGKPAEEDPMRQIVQILSSHLESLQWIDGAVRELDGKVVEVDKRVRDSGVGASLGAASGKSRGFGVR